MVLRPTPTAAPPLDPAFRTQNPWFRLPPSIVSKPATAQCVINWTVHQLRFDTRCYFNVRSKAAMSQLNLPCGTDD